MEELKLIGRQFITKLKSKIWPFFIIGALFPIFEKLQHVTTSCKAIKKYLDFVEIKPNFLQDYNKIIKEHFVEYTLIYGFILLILISFLIRIIGGQIRQESFVFKYIIVPFRDFLLELSISLIGLLSGFAVISIFYNLKITLFIAITLTIPFVLSFLILFFSSIPSNPPPSKGLFKKIQKPQIRSRLEGFFLLIIAFVFFTFHKYIFRAIDTIGKFLNF